MPHRHTGPDAATPLLSQGGDNSLVWLATLLLMQTCMLLALLYGILWNAQALLLRVTPELFRSQPAHSILSYSPLLNDL